MKYWEIIADNLSNAGWSWGCVSAIDSNGRTIWIADAHRSEVQRFIVRAEEKLTAPWPHLQPDRSANSGQHVQCRMAYAWPFFTSSNS